MLIYIYSLQCRDRPTLKCESLTDQCHSKEFDLRFKPLYPYSGFATVTNLIVDRSLNIQSSNILWLV